MSQTTNETGIVPSRQLPETLEFADWNKGKSFFEQFELIGPNGLGSHICVDIRDEIRARELARRIVACWNVCAGIPTEDLEAAGQAAVAKGDDAELFELLRLEGFPMLEEIRKGQPAVARLVEEALG